MSQEQHIMKMFKIAAATAVLALASGYAAAVPMTVGVTLSSPISLTLTTPLSMPSLVVPTTGTTPSSVTLPADGSAVTYGGGGGAGSNGTSGTIGLVKVTGESSYTFKIMAAATNPTGLTLTAFSFYDAAGSAPTTSGVGYANFPLSLGLAYIKIGATLSADPGASAAPIPVDVTVVYAP